jgi:hypothetical protein
MHPRQNIPLLFIFSENQPSSAGKIPFYRQRDFDGSNMASSLPLPDTLIVFR